MSYIRGLSNPEKLYIVGSGVGRVEFVGEELYVPKHVFHGLWYYIAATNVARWCE